MSDAPPPPWRIRGVEPIPHTTLAQRRAALDESGGNLFRVPSRLVGIDLLTDSGTGAMSQAQWAAILTGDEAYAGSTSHERLSATVERLFGFAGVLPCHQGRAAEHVAMRHFAPRGGLVVSNHLFDTTQAHAQNQGFRVASCLGPPGPFGGGFDLGRLAGHLEGGDVAAIVATVTCNSAGGLPVSLENLREARGLADANGVPMWLDAARIAENGWFQHRGGEGDSPAACARSTMDLADGFFMSAKKDGLANIGGLLACRDEGLRRRFAEDVILFEGFPTYGGLAGRDLAAIAVGLEEALSPRYLAHRTGEVAALHDALSSRGVPLVSPPGGHAVFVDAGEWLGHLEPADFPGHSLALALYLASGVRACEIGSLLIGRDEEGRQLEPPGEYLRLAVPRRTYTSAHLEEVARAFASLAPVRETIPPARMTEEPERLRHFMAEFSFPWTPPAR